MPTETGGRPLLIRRAEVDGVPRQDVLIADGRIAGIGANLAPPDGADTVDADGDALLPGLVDHHLHLASLATARTSVSCGPPEVSGKDELAARLRRHAQGRGADDWLRGIGYHEAVAGDIDAVRLDRWVDWCPVRVQHRGGRLWVFNSRALDCLRLTPRDPVERRGGRPTGRLFDGDVWLRERLCTLEGAAFPGLAEISRGLASHGITAVTDTTPHNGPDTLERFRAARERDELLQTVMVMGDRRLDSTDAEAAAGVKPGAHKFHLLESALPDFDDICAAIAQSHDCGRAVAFHCVTRAELVFALAALEAVGSRAGDRIEHASVTPPELVGQIRDLGLSVVTQPVFVHQRGEQYLERVAAGDRPHLYRLRAFLEAGIPLAGSSDAPFGDTSPWRAMQAAVTRRTRAGRPLVEAEALSPEQALALYTSPAESPGRHRGPLREGDVADLCLLDRPWSSVRADPGAVCTRLTLRGGYRIWP